MTDKEMIEERLQSEGLTAQSWVEDTENGLTAKLGRYQVVNDDEEDYGLYAGDEGELSACVVGSAQYGNQRVSFSFTLDDNDEGSEVHSLSVLEPIDA